MAAHSVWQIYRAIYNTLSPTRPLANHTDTLLDPVMPPPLPAAMGVADSRDVTLGWEPFTIDSDRSN